jgi:Tol biopolymer transport system component
MVRDLETGTERDLYGEAGPGVIGPSLSPDGTRVAFFSTDSDRTTVMTISTAGGPPTTLYRGESGRPVAQWTAWTADGRYILGKALDPGQRIWAFPANGGDPIKLDLAMTFMRTIDVSPDGKQIVLWAGRDKPEFWMVKNLLLELPAK